MKPLEILSEIDTNNLHKGSGIYMIFCISNGKCYIGRSKNIKLRWYYHNYCLRKNFHPNIYLQNVYNKYGKDSLVFFILENTNERDAREFHWIEKIDKDLLMNLGAITEEFPMTEEIRIKISKKNKWRKHSSETKMKISKSINENWNNIYYREKFSECQRGKKMPKSNEQSRKNMSIAQKKWHTENSVSDNTKKKKSDSMKQYCNIPENKEKLINNLRSKKN